MTSPPVRFVRTPDGMDIAYAVGGEGPQLVFLPFHHNHVEIRWTAIPWVSGMAQRNRVLHYDSRGQGLSSRGLDRQPTIDDYVTDLESTVAAAGFDAFALVAYGGFAHVAIRYAERHPGRVKALLLICTAASHKAWPQAAWVDLAEQNWDLFLELEIRADWAPEVKAFLLKFANEAANQADYVKMVRCFADSNVSDVLPKLSLPTLLLHSRNQHWLSPEEGIKLAARIPGARLAFIDGGLEPDVVPGVQAMQDFLTELHESPAAGKPRRRNATLAALTARQLEVLRLVAAGKTTSEISDELVLSVRTVERHISDIYNRTGVRNRSEATALVLEAL